MATAKLQDLQETTITVAIGAQTNSATINPKLQTNLAVKLAPDMITAEIVDFVTGGGSKYGVVSSIVRGASDFVLSVYLDAKAAVGDSKVTVRTNAVYFHTIQGADRTP